MVSSLHCGSPVALGESCYIVCVFPSETVSFRSVSGSLPVIAPYMAEFIRNKYRGPVLGISSTFWMVGRLLCGAFAWIIIPMGLVAPFNFHSWRLFIAISALPSLLGAAAYFLLPESPRFLLEVCVCVCVCVCVGAVPLTHPPQVGKEKEALKALRLAYRINNLCRRGARFPVSASAVVCVCVC